MEEARIEVKPWPWRGMEQALIEVMPCTLSQGMEQARTEVTLRLQRDMEQARIEVMPWP